MLVRDLSEVRNLGRPHAANRGRIGQRKIPSGLRGTGVW